MIDRILVETSFMKGYEHINNEIYTILKQAGYSCYRMTINSLRSLDYKNEKDYRLDVIWTCVQQ